jgi:hypothetical protein
MLGVVVGTNIEPLRAGLRSVPALRRLVVLGEEAGEAACATAGWLAMSMDNELQKHYAQLLGIGSPWEVKTVELKLTEKKVEIELGWQWGATARCPECQRECTIVHQSGPGGIWTRCSLPR